MLGRRKTYRYTSDTGVSYQVLLREATAAAAGFVQIVRGSLPYAPKHLRKRYFIGIRASTGDKRRIYHPTGLGTWFSATTFTVDGTTYQIATKVSERRTR